MQVLAKIGAVIYAFFRSKKKKNHHAVFVVVCSAYVCTARPRLEIPNERIIGSARDDDDDEVLRSMRRHGSRAEALVLSVWSSPGRDDPQLRRQIYFWR